MFNLEKNHCVANPCFNGGECVNSHNHYECRCKPGFNGPECRNSEYIVISGLILA